MDTRPASGSLEQQFRVILIPGSPAAERLCSAHSRARTSRCLLVYHSRARVARCFPLSMFIRLVYYTILLYRYILCFLPRVQLRDTNLPWILDYRNLWIEISYGFNWTYCLQRTQIQPLLGLLNDRETKGYY